MDPAIREKAHQLKLLKSKAAAVGNLRAVKHYDLLLKKFLTANGVVYRPGALEVFPPKVTQDRLIEKNARGMEALHRHKVPSWFRPGYSPQIRVRLWLRLSVAFRQGLIKQHQKGLLPEYYPAPSYWAKKIKPSDFYLKPPPSVVVAQIEKEDPLLLQEEDPAAVVEVMSAAEDQSLALMDELVAFNAEAQEEDALVATLEDPGEGNLAAEEAWYQDPNKVFLAAVAGVIALAVIK